MPSASETGGFDIAGVVYLAIVLAVMFMPVFLGRSQAPPSTDSDHDGGGGPDPSPPPDSPNPPTGGVPLPDAEQSALRLPDHGRPGERRRRRRHRPAHDPVRTQPPVKTP